MAIIVVDPGHGGNPPPPKVDGSSWNHAVGPPGTNTLEKTLTLDVGLRLHRILAERGHQVILTRDSDVNLGLRARAGVAKQANADAFVSIHFNGFNGEAQGTETFIHERHGAQSAALANAVQPQLVRATGLRDRGVKKASFGVVNPDSHAARTAAILVEVSFMDVADEELRLRSSVYRGAIATALADGIEAHVGRSRAAGRPVEEEEDGFSLAATAQARDAAAAAPQPRAIRAAAPAEASPLLLELVALYRGTEIEFPDLKAVTLAQWILESGWGHSPLATEHHNFGGLKWRSQMAPYAHKVRYRAHDGEDDYCGFDTLEDFIAGYWAFLDRPAYKGWRKSAGDPEAFIRFIGQKYAEDDAYAGKVLALLAAAERLLAGGQAGSRAATSAGGQAGSRTATSAEGDDVRRILEHADETARRGQARNLTAKPRVNRFVATTHHESRNGTDIDHVVLHYTTSRVIAGTIEHFVNGVVDSQGRRIRTSAHYIIGQDGELVQMVEDADAAWHAGNKAMNLRSIGIEHSARTGDRLTAAQEATSLALLRWLMAEYAIPASQIIPHDQIRDTKCPGDLFADHGHDHGPAIQAWLAAKL